MERSMDNLQKIYADEIKEVTEALANDPSYAIDIANQARKILKRKRSES